MRDLKITLKAQIWAFCEGRKELWQSCTGWMELEQMGRRDEAT